MSEWSGKVAPVAVVLLGCFFIGGALAWAPVCVSPACVGALLGIAAAFVLATAIRRSSFAASLTWLEYCGVLLAAGGVATITFNGLRVTHWMTVSDLLLFGAGVILLPPLVLGRSRARGIPFWIGASAGMLGLAGALSAFRGGSPYSNLVPALQFVMALLFGTVVIALAAADSRRLFWFASLWLVSGFINGAVGLSDLLGLTALGTTFAGRVGGLTVHPNHLGLACAMVLPVGISRFATSPRVTSRAVYALLMMGAAAGVLASGSRAGLLGAALGVLLLALLQRRVRAQGLLILFISVAVLMFVVSRSSSGSADLLTGAYRLTGSESVGTSDTTRLAYYDDALAGFAESPLFGEGFNVARGAHDIYLQLLQAGGVLAIGAFALFGVGVVRLGLRLVSDDRLSNPEREIAPAFVASFAVWLMVGLVQNPIYDRFLYVPAALVLALYFSSTSLLEPLHSPARPGTLQISTLVTGQPHSYAPSGLKEGRSIAGTADTFISSRRLS